LIGIHVCFGNFLQQKIANKDGWAWHRYNGVIVCDLRRSSIRNLVNAGVPEPVATRISEPNIRAVFDRDNIVFGPLI
jgi:hypothetical protein